jgi:subtilisin family serine protease
MTDQMAIRPRVWAIAAVSAVFLAASSVPTVALGSTPDSISPRFVPGQVVVGFRNAATAAKRDRAVAAVHADVAERLPPLNARLLDLGEGGGVRDAVVALGNRSGVAYAQPNFIRRAQAIPNDPWFSRLWGLRNTGQTVSGVSGEPDADIDAPEAWDFETGSFSTAVAVVDTGVDYDHADLEDNIWSNPEETPDGTDDDGNGKIDDLLGWDFVDSDNSPLDENGHGTHVAGTIGAQGNNGMGTTGVVWDTSLMSLRVLDAGGHGTDFDVAAGFVYAAEEGADVVNASLGGPDPGPLMSDAVTSNPGTLYVVAAGNDRQDNDSSPEFPCDISAANLICVAASNQNDKLASFSNYGVSSVDLAAPGTNIYSTYPGTYEFLSGTSMATPHVTGAAALLFSATPTATVANVRSALLGSVDKKDSLTGKLASGGRLNVDAALRKILGRVPETEITDHPRKRSRDRTPTFSFASGDPTADFECRIDARDWHHCGSPRSYSLKPKRHRFRVRAQDPHGTHDATPARFRFRIR